MSAITPVSALHEYCAKKKFPLPTYEFIDTTEDSGKSYACKVSALNTSATGIGRSKQEAKHEATYLLIKDVVNDYPDINKIPVCHNQAPITDTILQLRNLCLQNEYPLPSFTAEQVTGPAHSPQFTVKAQCMSISRYGTATSLTQARQLASQNVINVLHTIKNDEHNMQIDTFKKSYFTQQQTLRNQFQSYRDLTDEDIPLVSEGTTIANRHNYFTKYKDDVKLEAAKILNSDNYINNQEKITDLLKVLGIESKQKPSLTNDKYIMIELVTSTIDVVFINCKNIIYDEMVEYFKDMI